MAVLMQGQRQNTYVVAEGRLDAVAVVDVDVYVQNTIELFEEDVDAERDVVYVAETTRPIVPRVVHSSAPIYGHSVRSVVEKARGG